MCKPASNHSNSFAKNMPNFEKEAKKTEVKRKVCLFLTFSVLGAGKYPGMRAAALCVLGRCFSVVSFYGDMSDAKG
jgi:hypothetical protein